MPPARRRRRGASRPKTRTSRLMVVDSPPGRASASTLRSSSAVRTGRASAPARRKAARCSRTSPCRASTPIRTMASDPSETRAIPMGRRRQHLGHSRQCTQARGKRGHRGARRPATARTGAGSGRGPRARRTPWMLDSRSSRREAAMARAKIEPRAAIWGKPRTSGRAAAESPAQRCTSSPGRLAVELPAPGDQLDAGEEAAEGDRDGEQLHAQSAGIRSGATSSRMARARAAVSAAGSPELTKNAMRQGPTQGDLGLEVGEPRAELGTLPAPLEQALSDPALRVLDLVDGEVPEQSAQPGDQGGPEHDRRHPPGAGRRIAGRP